MGGAEDKALHYLSALAQKRDPLFEANGNLTTMIRKERLKELIGEGFRFYDLKRYGEGLQRSPAQNENVTTVSGMDIKISVGDHRWLWPIPQAEIDANPQLKNQQNPGYTQ